MTTRRSTNSPSFFFQFLQAMVAGKGVGNDWHQIVGFVAGGLDDGGGQRQRSCGPRTEFLPILSIFAKWTGGQTCVFFMQSVAAQNAPQAQAAAVQQAELLPLVAALTNSEQVNDRLRLGACGGGSGGPSHLTLCVLLVIVLIHLFLFPYTSIITLP